MTEEEMTERVLEEINTMLNTELTTKEKLFNTQRSITYLLKETAFGTKYTYPMRMTAVIIQREQGLVFHNIHFSFPSYWVLEGKVDEKILC